ncbi:uncharacterized protein LOC134981317 [Pseudophryne corroboree]|uniref:uncharacterized protein LOC134981317 n=1 Tax=Pseudophryne corroboree TaxID=495146 RepID=UPI0030821880
MVLYQPQGTVSVGINDTAVISCAANETLEDADKISWYRKSWRSGDAPLRVTSCPHRNGAHKYTCKNDKFKAELEIRNTDTTDSAVYYCTFLYTDFLLKIGNGTTLIAADSSTPRGSVHLLAPAPPPLPNTTVLLACVVHGARHTVRVTWKISGAHHRGRMISIEEPGGTWTFLSLISLTRDTWDHGEPITCDVWFNSSAVSVHWEMPERGDFTTKCQSYLLPALTGGLLLLLALSANLIWTFRQTDNKTQDSKDKENMIVYSQLAMDYLTGGRK